MRAGQGNRISNDLGQQTILFRARKQIGDKCVNVTKGIASLKRGGDSKGLPCFVHSDTKTERFAITWPKGLLPEMEVMVPPLGQRSDRAEQHRKELFNQRSIKPCSHPLVQLTP